MEGTGEYHHADMGGRPAKLGLCLAPMEDPITSGAPRWEELRACAQTAEQIGFDSVWIPDELLWRGSNWSGRRGWWECVSMTSAIAATTSRIAVGTWVMSAHYRNPALTAKIAETLDEIAGGRFIFGIGSGSGDSEAEAFGYPKDHIYSRFADALDVLVPLLRIGQVDHHGPYHQAVDLEMRPRGPRPGKIPLMIGAHGAKMMRLAARHADIWSGYASDGTNPSALVPLLDEFDRACEDVGRDPGSIGRSIGIALEPTEATMFAAVGLGEALRGSPQKIAEVIAEFAALGSNKVTHIELMIWPCDPATVETLAPMVEALDRA
jgi:alkanesulfonate monooxygenase SsuD/methylene tetrahydromethanopterin reductase-like flavin-dependent oxidoreductase (luciferase family)